MRGVFYFPEIAKDTVLMLEELQRALAHPADDGQKHVVKFAVDVDYREKEPMDDLQKFVGVVPAFLQGQSQATAQHEEDAWYGEITAIGARYRLFTGDASYMDLDEHLKPIVARALARWVDQRRAIQMKLTLTVD